MPEAEELITPQEAARRKGVTAATVYKACREGKLPYTEVLNRFALKPSDVDAWQPQGWGGRRPGQGRRRKDEEGAAA
jgi:excisionase family DNA binding protein